MKKRISQNLKLNKKSISKLQQDIVGGVPPSDSSSPSMDVSCFMSCVNYSKYDTCPDA